MKRSFSYKPKILISFIFPWMMLFSPALIFSAVTEDDMKCLEGVKNSLNDPDGKLNSWTFNNNSAGFICKFVGVSCWNEQENRLLGLQLRDMKLSGQLPQSLQYCRSLQNLDLSANKLSGNKLGTTYKAVLPGEKQFRYKMNRLGQLRHLNLTPLLGFCVVEEEKLLVYKHMTNGTLYSLLHGSVVAVVDWTTRFQILNTTSTVQLFKSFSRVRRCH